MLRILFFLLPLIFVVIAGPVWLASRRNGYSTWFPAQIITVVGMLVALVLLYRGVFGDVAGPMYMVIVVLGAALGGLVAALVLPRAK